MIDQFTVELLTLSNEGGWVLWALVALAFGIAFALISIWQGLQFHDAPAVADWKSLLRKSGELPAQRLSALRDSVGQGDLTIRLNEIENRLFSKSKRRIPFAFVLIGAAPLIGLLGTVSGMFTTFDGLAGVSTSAPVDVISRGVSEALITTQAGLIIGVPSFIVCTLLKIRHDRLCAGFQRLSAALSRTKTAC
ncbi:MAG: MotA/TolQ/ExbB proton channel family protein [Verrucomicrobiales bacterium]|nr:MotA/TolQ/ExbB proton channel family protein [Verrucomicrobiales bacterium]